MDQHDDHRIRSHRASWAAAVVAIVVLCVGAAVAAATDHRHEGRADTVHPGRPGPSRHTLLAVRAGARPAARQFVAALRARDRKAALEHATPTVYDELVRDEAGATSRVRLQRCARASGVWTCGLDFPSSGPADGESFSLTLTRIGSRWMATASAPLAG